MKCGIKTSLSMSLVISIAASAVSLNLFSMIDRSKRTENFRSYNSPLVNYMSWIQEPESQPTGLKTETNLVHKNQFIDVRSIPESKSTSF